MSASSASVEAQGKLNLFLRVLARESGGYHQLETLFVRLELADTVRVSTATKARELRSTGAASGPPERNVAFLAAERFASAAGWPDGFLIEIEKRLPVGGGLGGGSADAGAALRALNALAPKPLTARALAGVAFSVGADVPFLTDDVALALAWGRGERLLALRPLPAREVLLVAPPFGVSTKDAFGWLALARGSAISEALPPLAVDQLERWEQIARLAGNDLEGVVIERHPELGVALTVLETAGAKIARMTGSGSTLFGVFDRRPPPELGGIPDGFRVVHTRTATSVAPVRLLD